jgi:hypothetical protein
MRRIGCAVLALVFAGAAPAQPPAAPQWMAGAWIETKGDQWSDEFWTPMRGGVMIGSARIGKGEKLEMWEATRIERGEDGKLTFWASPRGVAPSPFPMVAQSSTMIEFANPAHDYPQRIRYWRAGNSLNAEISLIDGSKAWRWSYQPMGGKPPRSKPR